MISSPIPHHQHGTILPLVVYYYYVTFSSSDHDVTDDIIAHSSPPPHPRTHPPHTHRHHHSLSPLDNCCWLFGVVVVVVSDCSSSAYSTPLDTILLYQSISPAVCCVCCRCRPLNPPGSSSDHNQCITSTIGHSLTHSLSPLVQLSRFCCRCCLLLNIPVRSFSPSPPPH